MTHEEIKEKIKGVIIDKCGLSEEEIKDDSTLNSLGIDSLDVVEIVMEIEEEFDIAVPDTEAEKLANGTINEFATFVAGKTN